MDRKEQIYVVREGDTLSEIAADFGLTLAEIRKLNPEIKNPNLIRVGQRIRVSSPESEPDGEYEPFPGTDFFQPSVSSPIIEAMGYRLIEEGCSAYSRDPDYQWSEADQKSYAKWQRKLGYKGKDADGIPGPKSWERLHVPAVYE